jgi:hypothetical protein
MPRSFLLAALSLIASAAFAVDAPEPAYKGDVANVTVIRRVEQQPGAALLWEPYIAEWKPKNLVVAFGAGIPGKTDMGDILASVSADDGGKWSEPSYVFDHRERKGAIQFAYANPVLYHPPGQEVIWCFAMRCPMAYPHSEDSQLAAAYSGDGGKSWLPVELTMHYTGPLIIVAGIQKIDQPDGTPLYLLPAHRNTKRSDPLGSRDQLLLASTSLLEWKLRGYVPQPEAGAKVFLHEASLAPSGNEGELKMIMRTSQYEKEGAQLDPPRAWSTTSRDLGKTWTAAAQEPELWNSVSKAFYGLSRTGAHLYVYNDGPARSRMALRYKLQAQAGGAWSEEKTFFESGTKNSYPTLIEKSSSPGEFYCVWDSGTPERARTHIRFGKLKIAAGN